MTSEDINGALLFRTRMFLPFPAFVTFTEVLNLSKYLPEASLLLYICNHSYMTSLTATFIKHSLYYKYVPTANYRIY